MGDLPALDAIRGARRQLGDLVRTTPTWQWRARELEDELGDSTEIFLKLELWQYAGSFKTRGALLNLQALSEDALAHGVTAASAGNHAAAVSYAADRMGISAKVAMPRGANPARVAACRRYGAETVLMDDIHAAFAEAHRIEREEGRPYVHPFDGVHTALGTATVGLELFEQAPRLDAVVVPIGGGGLCAGIGAAIKQLAPDCAVYGVEPEGADTMNRSLEAGRPAQIERVTTIADSLGAPRTELYSFELCRAVLDDLVLVDDPTLRRAMRLMFSGAKLAVEPAAAASTAAVIGPLRERLQGKRVALIVCGSNIDAVTYCRLLNPPV